MNNITGTLINYFFHCQTQCWLHANRINLEDNSEDVQQVEASELEKEKEDLTNEKEELAALKKLQDQQKIDVEKTKKERCQ